MMAYFYLDFYLDMWYNKSFWSTSYLDKVENFQTGSKKVLDSGSGIRYNEFIKSEEWLLAHP